MERHIPIFALRAAARPPIASPQASDLPLCLPPNGGLYPGGGSIATWLHDRAGSVLACRRS
jgi:hypothetical protein